MSLPRAPRFLAALLLSVSALGVRAAGGEPEAPAWSEEPPAIARLLEGGYRAELKGQPRRLL